MSELRGLSDGVRALLGVGFRDGTQPAVEYEPYEVDLGLGRAVDLGPLGEVLAEAKRRHGKKVSESDGWLGPRVHATLRLTRREASDRRLWAYLNVAAFPDFVRWRWRDLDDEAHAVPLDRFLGEDSKNHLGRLWWGAELTRNGGDYSRTERAFGHSRFSVSWQNLDAMHHRPAALAIVEFLTGFDGGKGTTDSQGTRMARAFNAALRTVALDAMAPAPEPDAEALREWIAAPVDATRMMDALPQGPDDKDTVADAAVAEVRRHLDELASAIGLSGFVRKHRKKARAE